MSVMYKLQCCCLIVDENTKGVPDFWLTIFKNVEMLAEMVQVSVVELFFYYLKIALIVFRCV